MAKVRRATLGDLSAMVALGQAMHQESPRYRDMQFDTAKVGRLLQHLVTAGDAAGVVLVAEEGGLLIGGAIGIAGERWFGPDRYVTDLAVYLSPDHRGGRAFMRLVDAFEEWTAAQGVTKLDIGVSTGVHVERTVCAYERLGYTLDPTRIVTKTLKP